MATEVQPPPVRSSRSAGEPPPSVGDLLKRLRDEALTLLQQEVRLARTETAEQARTYGRNIAILAIGGAVSLAGLLFLLLGISHIVSALLAAAGASTARAAWLGPLIVGVVAGVVGAIVVKKSINALKRKPLVPEQTLRSLQENKRWVKEKLN